MRCNCSPYCLKETEIGRTKSRSCRERIYRRRNPTQSALSKIRWRAKRDGIIFKLSQSYWEEFCETTGYLKLRGREKDKMSVDRKINSLGYVDGNLQMLSVGDNARKGNGGLENMKSNYKPDGCPF
jgi:hypothetical protein